MNCLGIPQDRIAKLLEAPQRTVSHHSAKLATLPFWLNADLSKGYTVAQVGTPAKLPKPRGKSLLFDILIFRFAP